MNKKLAGTIFILFGIGLIGDAAHNLYYDALAMDKKTIKTIFSILLGISSCIYGYKRLQ